MKPKPESELVLNDDGSIYHLQLHSEQIADTIISCWGSRKGTANLKHFDNIEHKILNREFVTHTGYIGSKRLTALSTGIGTDNIDIVINELDALVNIDLEKRIEKKRKESIKYYSTWDFWSCSSRYPCRLLYSIYTWNGNGQSYVLLCQQLF